MLYYIYYKIKIDYKNKRAAYNGDLCDEIYSEIMFSFSIHDLHTLCPLNSMTLSIESQKTHAGAYFLNTILSPSVKISTALSLSTKLKAFLSSFGRTKRPASSMGLTMPADFINPHSVSIYCTEFLPATTIYQKMPKKSMNFERKSRTYFKK